MIETIFALFSTLGYGLNQLFNRKLIDKTDTVTAILYANIFLVAVGLIITLLTKSFVKITAKEFFLIMLFGLISFLPMISLFKGLQKSKVALIVPTANTFPIFVMIFSAIFLQITISLPKIFTILIIVAGVFLLSIEDIKNIRMNKMIIYGILTAIGWAAFSIFIKVIQDWGINAIAAAFYIEIPILIWSAAYYVIMKRKLEIRFTKQTITFSVLSGIFTMGATFMFALAIAYGGNPSTMSAISSAAPAITTIAAFFWLKERTKMHQLAGIIITVIGVAMLSLL